MGEYFLGEYVDLDLEDIWEYIAQGSPEAARSWIAELLNAFETIAKNPGIGHKRQDLTDYSVFFFTIGQYTIIYRILSERVHIVAVTQGARDIPVFLRRRMLSLSNS